MRSRSSARASPTRGRCAASGGQSAGSVTATTRSPAPAAYKSSVALGARLTIRRAGAGSAISVPVPSTAVTGLALLAPASAAISATAARVGGERSSVSPAYACEQVRGGGTVVGGQLVMLVQQVVEPRESRPVRLEGPFDQQ